MPGGRLAANVASESGSFDAAKRLYPGVEISISIALRSMRVEIVATFHCVPDAGSRRISVIWKPGSGLCVGCGLLCRGGDCPGFRCGDPARSFGRGGNFGLLESRLSRPVDKASYFSFQVSRPRSANRLQRSVLLVPSAPLGNGSSLAGTGGRGRRGTVCSVTESPGASIPSLPEMGAAFATGVPAKDIFSAETCGIGIGRRGNGGGAVFSSSGAVLSC